MDRHGQELRIEPRGWRRKVVINTVESHDGVQVHDAPPLVLDDLGEGETNELPQQRARDSSECCQMASDGYCRPPPQLSSHGVPEHRSGIVEAVRTERLAHES